MPKTKLATSRFLICVENKGTKPLSWKRKVYVSIPDAGALKHGQVRVVDESGDDYLYPKTLSLPITVSASLRKAILKAA